MRVIDLNADLGEGGMNDAALIALVSSANIACGGHAGDETTMRAALGACVNHGVAAGAHPGYEDPEHFGRRPLDLPPASVGEMVARQLERFARAADAVGAVVHHVKPHGALYHQADENPALADVVARRVAAFFPGCFLYVPPAGGLAAAAEESGLLPCVEGFADRRYAPNGKLVSREQAGAVIEDVSEAISQALAIVRDRRVTASDGSFIPLFARTLCVHGDGSHALGLLRAIREALASTEIALRAP